MYFSSLGLLWIFVPALYGLPSVPTKQERIRKALQLVNLQPHEILYDLGAGDGRVLLIAAREFNAKASRHRDRAGPMCVDLAACRRQRIWKQDPSEVGELFLKRI